MAMDISYDSRAVKLVQIAKGSFLAQDGQPVAVVERTDEASGKTTVTLSRPPGSGSVSGGGDLAILKFQAVQAGATALDVVPAGTSNASQHGLPLRGTQTTITIR